MKNPNRLLLPIFIFTSLLILHSCGTQSDRRHETDPVDVPTSHLSFNIHFPIDELQAGVNALMKPTLVDDEIQVNNKGDKLFLKVVKKGDLKLSLKDDEAHASLPLSVDVAIKKKMMGITFSNEYTPISFTGRIETVTTASLDENWDFSLHCREMTLIWDKEPKLNVLGLEIDLTQTMEKALEQNEEKILNELCSSVNKSIDFKKAFNKVWKDIQRPIRIAKKPDSLWLYSRPQAINAELLPLIDDTLSIHVEYKSTVHITSVNEVNWEIQELPKRGPTLSDRSAIIAYVEASIPFDFISGILEKNILEQKFEYEQYHAQVNDVEVGHQDGKVKVSIDLTGDLNGTIILLGKPFLNKKGELSIDNFSFEVISDDKVTTAADWITHSFIETHIANKIFLDASKHLEKIDHLANAGIAKSNAGDKLATSFEFDEISSYGQYVHDDGIQWVFYVEGRGDLTLKKNIFRKKSQ